MDSIPEDPILKFCPDTLIDVRKKYNLNKPGVMDRAIDILEEWIKQQDHFTMRKFSREYLERSIITSKGSIERAKIQIDTLCTMRTLLPQFFEKSNPKEEFPHLSKILVQALLPKLTEDHYRIYMPRIIRNGVDSKTLFLGYQHAVLEGYDTRVKGIHLISNSKAIEILVKLFKQLLSKKIGGRIHVHNSNETLYEHVPRELLPIDYGGEEKQYKEICDDWIEELSTEKNIRFFEEMKNAQTNEALRSASDFNINYIGMAGTFRNLTVD